MPRPLDQSSSRQLPARAGQKVKPQVAAAQMRNRWRDSCASSGRILAEIVAKSFAQVCRHLLAVIFALAQRRFGPLV